VEAPPVAKKKRQRASPETIKKAVARVASGEAQQDVAAALGVSASSVSKWVATAGESAGKGSSGNDIASLARELAECLARAEKIKRKMRKILGA
jgi:transposase-like protein